MRLVVLGSGTSVPQPGRRPPAFLVYSDDRAGNTVRLLIDCGAGCATGLATHGITLDRLDGIVLTHLHLDHTLELAGMLFALHNPLGPQRDVDLRVWGPAGTRDYFDGLKMLYGSWVDPRSAAVLTAELADEDGFVVGPLTVTAFAVEHGGPALAYRIDDGERVLCISGDSGYCKGLIQAARSADLFACECAALEGEPSSIHLSASDVGRVAVAAGCSRVLLTHLYAHVVASDPVSRVRQTFAGPVMLAEDDLSLDM